MTHLDNVVTHDADGIVDLGLDGSGFVVALRLALAVARNIGIVWFRPAWEEVCVSDMLGWPDATWKSEEAQALEVHCAQEGKQEGGYSARERRRERDARMWSDLNPSASRATEAVSSDSIADT